MPADKNEPKPMPTSVIGGIATQQGSKIVGGLLQSLMKQASGRLKKKIRTWKTAAHQKTLFSKISAVRNVKTIWSYSEPIDLFDFYHPTSLILKGNKRVQVDDLDALDINHLVVEGIAGQGKSVFLRYLCSRELQKSERIPIFLQLGRIQQVESLEKAILNRVRALGFKGVIASEFYELCESGKVILFLDAFDEINLGAKQTEIATSIEELAETYPGLGICVSSRPGSAISRSPQFRNHRIASIHPSDLSSVIAKLTGLDAYGSRLIKALEKKPSVKGVLTTPLMITLLVITYRARQKIPENLTEFFDCLFDVLVCQHDENKPGISRPRKTELSDRNLNRLFDGICFFSRVKSRTPDFKKEQMHDIAERAINESGIDCDESELVTDIVQITNLILREGGIYSFVHRSIQEFHSASFVRQLPQEETAKKFYESVFHQNRDKQWRSELRYLREIDEFRFTAFFAIPLIELFFEKYLKRQPTTWKKTPKTVIKRILNEYHFYIDSYESKEEENAIDVWLTVSDEKEKSIYGRAALVFSGLGFTRGTLLEAVDYKKLHDFVESNGGYVDEKPDRFRSGFSSGTSQNKYWVKDEKFAKLNFSAVKAFKSELFELSKIEKHFTQHIQKLIRIRDSAESLVSRAHDQVELLDSIF